MEALQGKKRTATFISGKKMLVDINIKKIINAKPVSKYGQHS